MRTQGRPERARRSLALLVLAAASLLTLDFRGPSWLVDEVRGAVTDAVAPVRRAGDAAFAPLGDVVGGITRHGALEAENEALRRQVADLEGAALRGADAEAELEALLDAAGVGRFTDLETVAARVVATSAGNVEQTIRIDRGRDDGVAQDQPVATGAGLVGRVVAVSDGHAVVRLVTDPTSAVGARLSAGGELAVAEGAGPGRPLRLALVDPGTPVAEGDLVVTSGTDGSFFPAGIPLGLVGEAGGEPAELEQPVTVVPSADLERLRFVHVLRTVPG